MTRSLISHTNAQDYTSSAQEIAEGMEKTNGPGRFGSKVLNIRFQPLYFFYEGYYIEGEFNLFPHLTLGPQFSKSFSKNFADIKTESAHQYGLVAHYYVNESSDEDSWYLKAHTSLINTKSKGTFNNNYSSNKELMSFLMYQLGGGLGYQWMWEYFNIHTGFSHDLIYQNKYSSLKKINHDTQLELSLGLAF